MARGSSGVPNPSLNPGIKPAVRDALGLMSKAYSGDVVMVITPATAEPLATAAAWTQTFYVELQTAAGELHTWFNKAITSGHSVADTSTAGTATVSPATTTTFVNGIATIVMSGDAAAWLLDETATLTVAAFEVMGYTIAEKTGVVTFAGTSASPSKSPSVSPSKSPSVSPSVSPSA